MHLHTHTHSHTHAHRQTDMHMHSLTHTHSLFVSLTHMHTDTHTAYKLTHRETGAHAHSLSHTLALSHTHMNTDIYAYKFTHTYTDTDAHIHYTQGFFKGDRKIQRCRLSTAAPEESRPPHSVLLKSGASVHDVQGVLAPTYDSRYPCSLFSTSREGEGLWLYSSWLRGCPTPGNWFSHLCREAD